MFSSQPQLATPQHGAKFERNRCVILITGNSYHASFTIQMEISLVSRLLCVGGEKRAWYTLFAHAQFLQDFWEFWKFP